MKKTKLLLCAFSFTLALLFSATNSIPFIRGLDTSETSAHTESTSATSTEASPFALIPESATAQSYGTELTPDTSDHSSQSPSAQSTESMTQASGAQSSDSTPHTSMEAPASHNISNSEATILSTTAASTADSRAPQPDSSTAATSATPAQSDVHLNAPNAISPSPYDSSSTGAFTSPTSVTVAATQPDLTPTPAPVPFDDHLTGAFSTDLVSAPAAWPGARTQAPASDNAYYFMRNPFYQSGFGMPNCTAYAYGRAWELLGSQPELSRGNANSFWGYNIRNQIYAYGQEARLGALVCWNSGTEGHVAVVEEIKDDEILISESYWQGTFFKTRWIPQRTPQLQGYIYLADFQPGPKAPLLPLDKDHFIARLLSPDGRSALGADGRGALWQAAESNSPNQYWQWTRSEGGFKLRAANGYLLEAAGFAEKGLLALQLGEAGNNPAQNWLVEEKDGLVRLSLQDGAQKLSLGESSLAVLLPPESASARAQDFKLEILPAVQFTAEKTGADGAVKLSLATQGLFPEAYLKIYKGTFGQGGALTVKLDSPELIRNFESGHYEIQLEYGSGQALSRSEVIAIDLP